MRATTLLNNLLDLPGVGVSGVSFDDRRVLVERLFKESRVRLSEKVLMYDV